MGGIIHRIPYISEVGPFKYQKLLKDFFSNHPEYQILHSHLDKMSGMVCKAAKKSGVSIRIAHSHNTESEGNLAIKLFKWYSGMLVQTFASHYTACSKNAAIWLFGKSYTAATIIKNGVESEQFLFSKDRRRLVRHKLNLMNDEFVVGHVGRFHIEKNHAFLIEIFAETLKSYPKAKLVLAGDGPLRKRIERLVFEKGLRDHVLFLGIREDIPDLYRHSISCYFPPFMKAYLSQSLKHRLPGFLVFCLIKSLGR